MNIGNRKKLFLVVMSCVSPGYALAQQITDAAGITYGAPPSIGLNNDLGDGGQGGDIYSKSVDLDFFSPATVLPGANGDSDNFMGGGGQGEVGGASVIGGFSQGGSAAYSEFPITNSASGGHGGEIGSNVIKLNNLTLSGAAGGDGGGNIGGGGGGGGGAGGGSIFGGVSLGGAAGGSYMHGRELYIANGGDGGSVVENKISLNQVELHGAAGGAGGLSLYAGGLGGRVADQYLVA